MNEYENMAKEELLTRCLFLEEVVEERNEQIEKMKCCGNCKHQIYNYEYRYCELDATREKECEKGNQWELYE